jgi:hypothetical protein
MHGLSIGGVGFRDPFGEALVLRAERAGAIRVAVPPGRDVTDAVTKLATAIQARIACKVAPMMWDERDSTTLSGVVARLAEGFEWAGDHVSDVGAFMEAYRTWLQERPNVAVIGVPRCCAPRSDALDEQVRSLATAARDEPGFLSVIQLVEGGGGEGPVGIADVWPSLLCGIEPPILHISSVSVLETSWRSYRAQRLYWEAGGQPAALEHLHDCVGLLDAPSVPDRADEEIDRALHLEWSSCSPRTGHFEQILRDALIPSSLDAMMRTGMIISPKCPASELLSCGFAWRPPFSDTLWLTANAARHLAEHPEVLGDLARLGLTVSDLLHAVSANTIVPTWVLGLTSVVERHLLGEVSRDTGCVEFLRQGSAAPEWRVRRRVADRLAYHKGGFEAFDADFGDLIRAAGEGGGAFGVRVSDDELRDVKDVRNQCAHLRPVGWSAIARVIRVLERLAEGD